MSWVPIHESALADSVDFGFIGEGVTFADSIVSQSEWGGAWWIALPTYPDLPLFRVSVLEWAGEFIEFSLIFPLSWGFHWQPGFITSLFNTIGQVFNESPTPDSEWVPSPIQIEFPPPSSLDDFAIIQSTGFGEWEPPTSAQWLIEVWVDDPPPPPEECNFNCECDDPNPSRTLAELRTELMRRAGMSAMTANPPPGMTELLNSFLQSSQRMLYRQYPVLRTERFFTWDMVQGTRFYDLDANRDVCTKKLDARMLSWVGISDGCDEWRPLVCGIPPECYQTADQQGVPYRYEIRQCIEVWPAPDSDVYKLRIKGDFGLEPFEADEDQCTIDDEAVFLHALARLKAHQGDPDARNYQQDAMDYIGYLTAGAHLTRRYVPGECPEPPLPKPIWVPKVY